MTIQRSDDVEQLIAEFQRSGLRELHVRSDGLELYLSADTNAAGVDSAAGVATRDDAPAAASMLADNPTGSQLPQAAPPTELPPGSVIVRAPYLGTFYRSPKPGAEAYVEVGQRVEAETEICLVEVMKLFTAVRAGTAGTVHAILSRDGEMVAAEQPLFAIVPA